MKIKAITVLLMTFVGCYAQSPLDDYLAHAAENNPGLRAEYVEFQAALERAAEVSGLPNPTLSFGYFIQPVETRVGPQRAKVSLSQMFPWFGSLNARGNASAARAQAQYLQFIDAREQLKRKVKAGYYELWQVEELLKLQEENLDILRSYEGLATTEVSSGDGKLSDVYRVQMEIQETETAIRILKDQVLPLKQSFNRMLNRSVEKPIELPDTILSTGEIPVLDSVKKHPAVVQYEELRRGAEYQSVAATKSGLPSLGLGLDYVIVDSRDDMNVPDNGNDALMPMLSISLPIWRGQYRAARKEADLKMQQYDLQTEDKADQLRSEIDLALFTIKQSREEIKLYNGELELAQKTLELLISDYANDREELEEILRLQSRILHYQRQKIKSYVTHLKTKAQLEYLTYQYQEDES